MESISEQENDDRVDFAHVTALVVDDNIHMRRLMADILHAFGIGKIHQASDGMEALELLKTNPVQLVLCDWMMDKLNGIELLQEVRKLDASLLYHNAAFILMTAHDDEDRLWKAKQLGAAAILVKPFSSAALFEKILSCVETLAKRGKVRQGAAGKQTDSGL